MVKRPDSEQPSLHTASKDGWLAIVQSLLDRGSDINERDNLGLTALHAASEYGKLEVAKLLIERVPTSTREVEVA
jgi:ankyrin repeat protein